MKKSILTLATISVISAGTSAIGAELHARGRAGYYASANTQKETTVAIYPGKDNTSFHSQAQQAEIVESSLLLPRGRSGYVYR
jgi:hypothetical protein